MSSLTDRAAMKAEGERLQERYTTAEPFPYISLDDFFPAEMIDAVEREFPAPDVSGWKSFHHANSQVKSAFSDELLMGAATRNLIYYLNSSVFLDFLERMTGIDGLLPDPHLFGGGGLHRIGRGGFLKIHADFNQHKRLNLDRRLNLLIYLNPEWREEYGGHLELWDRGMTACRQSIAPLFNRMVVFNTTDYSYHGHPDPLMCPEGHYRRSVSMYYYTNGRPEEERAPVHSTLYQVRPGTDDPGPPLKPKPPPPPPSPTFLQRVKRRLMPV